MTMEDPHHGGSAGSPVVRDGHPDIVGPDRYRLPGHGPTKKGLYDMHAAATSHGELGRRAARLRADRDMTIGELAGRAGITVADVEAFEPGDVTVLPTMPAVHRVLSGDMALEQLFAMPRFETIEDVVAYEARRRGA